jgi:predicted phage terminase large subunit-like protein
MGIDDRTGAIYVLNVARGRWSLAEVQNYIKGAAAFDGDKCVIRLHDPGAAGKFQAQYLFKLLQAYNVWPEREEGSKPYRANPLAAQCEQGMVRLVQGDWNQAFIDELCAFPKGSHDDQVDAAAAAFRTLKCRQGGISLVAV